MLDGCFSHLYVILRVDSTDFMDNQGLLVISIDLVLNVGVERGALNVIHIAINTKL